MKNIKEIEYLEGVSVLLRADFNVPIKNGKVVDDFRIRAILPTVQYLQSKKAKIILIAHLESNEEEKPSLAPVAEYLNKIGIKTDFIKDYRKAYDFIQNDLKDGECLLLENLRFSEGEKKNDKAFAKELASLASIYVNEAFSVSHRKHASIVGIPELLPSYIGLQFEKEIEHLSKAFKPEHPFVFILGGAKFDTKLPLLNKFIDLADTIVMGGGLANDFLKEKGLEVGESLISEEKVDLSHFVNSQKFIIPTDIINQDRMVKSVNEVLKTDKILDLGPETMRVIQDKIKSAKFILWNGPLGLYEDGYKDATLNLAKMIAEHTSLDGAMSIVGGGDTLAAIAELGIENKISFVSSGGGAMLDFLANGTLSGIEAISGMSDLSGRNSSE